MHQISPFGDKSCKGLAFFVEGYCMVPINCIKYGFFLYVMEFDRLYGMVMQYGVFLTDIGHSIVASLLYGEVGHFSLMS